MKRKYKIIISLVMTVALLVGVAPTGLAALISSSFTVTAVGDTNVTKGTPVTFDVKVTNDAASTASGTKFSLVDKSNRRIAGTFTPTSINLGKEQTGATTLKIDTSALSEATYTFKVNASAPKTKSQPASSVTSAVVTFTVKASTADTTPPSVMINQKSGQADPAATTPVYFSIVFSENVTGFAANDVMLTGTAGATTVMISGTGANYEAAVSGMTGSGTITASIPADAVQDTALNGNTASTSSDNTVTFEMPQPPASIHYVAIGDSLATGTTGVSGTMNSYVNGFYAHLVSTYQGTNVTVTMKNLAVDGYTSSDLLYQLTYNAEFIQEVTNANVITVSIGGNNIMNAARSSSFWSIDEIAAAAGADAFRSDYPLIIAKIHDYNSSAVILSSTLYNPYNYANQPTGYSGDTALYTTAEKYIGSINTTITGTAVNNYYIADAHDLFYSAYGNGNMGTVTFFYPKYNALTWWFVKLTRDPHLNQTGQDQMRDLHTNLYDTILQGTSMSPQIAA